MEYPFKWIIDPGHAWLVVPTALVKDLSIEHRISKCSYVSNEGSVLFLEEDCDALIFIKALEERFKINFKALGIEEITLNGSWIGRTTLPRYQPITLQ